MPHGKHWLAPNQALKSREAGWRLWRSLTEVAVDDFAAREVDEIEMINRYVRAMNYMELADRCRSLAPVR